MLRTDGNMLARAARNGVVRIFELRKAPQAKSQRIAWHGSGVVAHWKEPWPWSTRRAYQVYNHIAYPE
jgi:hypothetical protein